LTERRQARRSAWIVGAVLLAFGAWSVWRGHPLRAQVLCGLGVYLMLIGALAPRWAVPFHRAWMKLAHALGYINSRVILGLLYYGIFTPLGVVLRLTGRDPLQRRRAARESYWIPRAEPRQRPDQFERLF
jgi:hypothetical protein